MNLTAIGIVCTNLQKSIQFYENLDLNFQKYGDDHFEATTKSGIRIMLDSVDLIKKINPEYKHSTNTAMILALEQTSPNLVDSLIKKMKDKNYKIIKNPWDAFWGQRYSSIQDPDGNQIDIFSNMENLNDK